MHESARANSSDQHSAARVDPLDVALNAPVVFGLRAQGHLPTIKRMLAEGRTWEAIGREIGWDPETTKRHFYVTEADDADA